MAQNRVIGGRVCYSRGSAPLWCPDVGWERGGRYYTRSRRVNGRVIREYVGSGELAQYIAMLDQCDRAEKAADRALWREEKAQMRRLDESLQQLDTLCALVTRATLQTAGYRQHDRGAWRKRRD